MLTSNNCLPVPKKKAGKEGQRKKYHFFIKEREETNGCKGNNQTQMTMQSLMRSGTPSTQIYTFKSAVTRQWGFFNPPSIRHAATLISGSDL